MKVYLLVIFTFLLAAVASAQSQNDELCIGYHWSEDEANIRMKEFMSTWDDRGTWEKRAEKIISMMMSGMQLDQMPEIDGEFNPVITNTRVLDGYILENIRIESFPGFYITGNLYRPVVEKSKYPAILIAHGHGENQRLQPTRQYQGAVLARMGAIAFAYDMVGMGDAQQVDKHKMPIALLLQTWNSKRVLEYLLSRSDVDENQIGMTGASGGAPRLSY